MSRSLLPTWYVLLVAIVAPAAASPPQAVAVALADARQIGKDRAYYTRYLDLTFTDSQAVRQQWFQVISFHVNQLSREATIKQPRLLGGDAAVIAFDLRDYGISRVVYGRFGWAEAKEPYFHVIADVTEKDQYGRLQTHRRALAAPWVVGAGMPELIQLCDSQVPVLRADWFLYQTAIQKDRVAGYYDFLELGKKEADFQRLIAANPAESKRVKREMAASLSASGVTLNNRAITRLQSITGGYWLTQDYKTSQDKQNTARLLDGAAEPPQGDASEQYGVLPNGLFAYWLQNDKGERQDAAPDFIASDSRSTSNDRRVHVGLSCVRCHVEGLRPINDFSRRLFQDKLQLRSFDYGKLQRLQQLYLSDLPGQLNLDVAFFAAAVKQCNSLDVAENARMFALSWEAYESSLTPKIAALELGLDEKAFLEKLKAYAAATPVFDPVVGAMLQEPPIPVRREHFEEAYLTFQKACGGVQ